jgi:hypothetical protein
VTGFRRGRIAQGHAGFDIPLILGPDSDEPIILGRQNRGFGIEHRRLGLTGQQSPCQEDESQ